MHAGYPVDAEAILLCELDGVESDVQEDCERVNDILLKAGATDVRLAKVILRLAVTACHC